MVENVILEKKEDVMYNVSTGCLVVESEHGRVATLGLADSDQGKCGRK